MSQKRWFTLAKFFLDSGTEYFAAADVRHPNYLYEGRCENWGYIEKSIPSPVGPPEISHAKIRLADKDRKWRDLLTHQTAKRRLIELKFVKEGDSESAAVPFFVGEVVDVDFTPAAIEVELADHTYAWLDEEIPAFVIKENFPYVEPKDEGQFLCFVAGDLQTPNMSPPGPRGQIPCPHIGLVGGVDRFGYTIHTSTGPTAVYRHSTITVNKDDTSEWELVDPSEYNYTVQSPPIQVFDLDVTPQYIDFLEQQPDGTEIRADGGGINFRGPWDGLGDTNSDGSILPLQNPIDFFMNMAYFLTHKAGFPTEVVDVDETAALREQFRTGIGGSPSIIPLCAGVIYQPMTGREWLTWFLTSFNLDLYTNKRGLISLRFTPPTNPTRFLITEGHLIEGSTFIEHSPDPAINQVIYLFEEHPAEQLFQTWGVLNNDDDQLTLGGFVNSSPTMGRIARIEKEEVELHFVRDPVTAADTIQRRMEFMSLGSYRQEFQCPLAEVINEIELGDLIGITHKMGLDDGGYVNREAKVIGMTVHLDEMRMSFRTILRSPQSVTTPSSP